MYWAFQHYQELATIREAGQLSRVPESPSFLVETSQKVDKGPTANWLYNTIKKFGLKEAGKKVSTI
jgi:hypothetical protein